MSRERRATSRRRRYRPNGRVVIGGAGILAICAGIAFAVHTSAFLIHSSVAGHALVGQERKAIAAAAGKPAACQPQPGRTPDVGGEELHGLILVPALGLVAPVLQGTSDPVLSDEVGHDPASVTVSGPDGTGRYDLVVNETVSRGKLRVTQVGMTPAR